MKAIYFDGDTSNMLSLEKIEIENDLNVIREKIGGDIESAVIDGGKNIIIYDKDAHSKPNGGVFTCGELTLAGRVLIVGVGKNGEFCDCIDIDIIENENALGGNRERKA